MRKDMKRKIDSLVALLGAVLCACACLVGCGREEQAAPAAPAEPAAKRSVSRADDTNYQAQVRGMIDANRRTYAERQGILARMEQVRERARKALPANATDEQVMAEIEGNPQKYPAWRELVAALGNNAEELKGNNAAALSTVRRRVLREVAEQRKSAKQ